MDRHAKAKLQCQQRAVNWDRHISAAVTGVNRHRHRRHHIPGPALTDWGTICRVAVCRRTGRSRGNYEMTLLGNASGALPMPVISAAAWAPVRRSGATSKSEMWKSPAVRTTFESAICG